MSFSTTRHGGAGHSDAISILSVQQCYEHGLVLAFVHNLLSTTVLAFNHFNDITPSSSQNLVKLIHPSSGSFQAEGLWASPHHTFTIMRVSSLPAQ